jgi:hypothetical protein
LAHAGRSFSSPDCSAFQSTSLEILHDGQPSYSPAQSLFWPSDDSFYGPSELIVFPLANYNTAGHEPRLSDVFCADVSPARMPRQISPSAPLTPMNRPRSAPEMLTSPSQCLSDPLSFAATKTSPFENRFLALASAHWTVPDNEVSPVVRTSSSWSQESAQQNGSEQPVHTFQLRQMSSQLSPTIVRENKPFSEALLPTPRFESLRRRTSPTAAVPAQQHHELSLAVDDTERGRRTTRSTHAHSRRPHLYKNRLDAPVLAEPPQRVDSPLTPLSTDCDSPGWTGKRRHDSESPTRSAILRKRNRRCSVLLHNDDQMCPARAAGALVTTDTRPSAMRTLPSWITIHSDFPLFYTRFPVSSYPQFENSRFVCVLKPSMAHPENRSHTDNVRKPHPGVYNPPRSAFDLYTPRFVQGVGRTKVGLCPICVEAVSRGGAGIHLWLSMKFSAFKWSVPLIGLWTSCNDHLHPER